MDKLRKIANLCSQERVTSIDRSATITPRGTSEGNGDEAKGEEDEDLEVRGIEPPKSKGGKKIWYQLRLGELNSPSFLVNRRNGKGGTLG